MGIPELMCTPPGPSLRVHAGEQPPSAPSNRLAVGPSPRVRGAARDAAAAVRGPGTIPAEAGSRTGRSSRAYALTGPSPRVRGAAQGVQRHGADRGTIPAGAGSRAARRCPVSAPRDHPRGCGEQKQPTHSPGRRLGPSPRVRGAAVPASKRRRVCSDHRLRGPGCPRRGCHLGGRRVWRAGGAPLSPRLSDRDDGDRSADDCAGAALCHAPSECLPRPESVRHVVDGQAQRAHVVHESDPLLLAGLDRGAGRLHVGDGDGVGEQFVARWQRS